MRRTVTIKHGMSSASIGVGGGFAPEPPYFHHQIDAHG